MVTAPDTITLTYQGQSATTMVEAALNIGTAVDIGAGAVTLISAPPTITVTAVATSGPVWEEEGIPNGAFDSGEHFFQTIQSAIDAGTTVSGDTIYVSAGTYTEQVLIHKSLTLTGSGVGQTIVKAPSGTRNSVTGQTQMSDSVIASWNSDYLLAAYPVGTSTPISVKVSGFTFDANQEMHQFNRFTGVLLKNVRGATIGDAGLFNSEVKGFNVADPSVTGMRVLENSMLTVDHNNIGYTIMGIATYGTVAIDDVDPQVAFTYNTLTAIATSSFPSAITMAYVTNGLIDHNTLPNGLNGIDLYHTTNSTVSNNVISNVKSGDTSTGLNMGWSIIAEGNSSGNVISGNTISNSELALWDSDGSNNNTFVNNILNGNFINVQVDNMGGTAPTGLQFHGNSFTGSIVKEFFNNTTEPTDATHNWWGTAISTGITAKVVGSVDTSPWFTDAAMTTLAFTTSTSTATTTATTGTSNTTQTGTSRSVSVTADIPAGATITGDSSWDGVLVPPTATTTTVAISGFDTTVTSAIAVGSSDSDLTFDKAVKLTFAGQAGKLVGYYNHAGTFATIAACSIPSPDQAWADDVANLAVGSSCTFNSGGDLVIWTKHFSTFVTYTQTAIPAPAPVASFSGGSVGAFFTLGPDGRLVVVSAIPRPVTLTAPAVGQVLGESAFRFTSSLGIGSRSDEVKELQNRLISEGMLTGEATGYFGSLTAQAVKRFQAKFGIGQLGIVGPQTREKLNSAMENATPGCAMGNKFSTSTGQNCPTSTSTSGREFGAAVSAFARSLGQGSKGDEVTKLQERLIKEGILSSTSTGYFGNLTREAVKKFQEKNGIEMTGTVGPKTRAVLNK